MYIPVASSITENVGVEWFPHGRMTATGDLLDAPITLAKQTPIWCTDLKEMVSRAKTYDAFALIVFCIVDSPNNQAFYISCSEQECTIYTTLSSAYRAATFKSPKTGSSCDKSLSSGWYRFLPLAGNRMASACVPTKRCGTAFTGWLSSPHPNMTDGIVSGKVCFHWSTDCCRRSQNIQVRNCGRFFVYKLATTVDCPMGFCAETKVNSSSFFFLCICSSVNWYFGQVEF